MEPDRIEIRDLEMECIVGVHPRERLMPQPLHLDVCLFLDTRAAGMSASLHDTVDYARLAGDLRFLLSSCRFYLLETAAEALCRFVLIPPLDGRPTAQVSAVRMTLRKPEALDGIATPSLTVFRRREDMTYSVEKSAFGEVDVILATRECGVYRLRIDPGRSIATHEHRLTDESEMVLDDGLILQGRSVRAGDAFHWPRRFPHRYDNPLSKPCAVLCVDRPSFNAGDEVPIDVPLTALTLPEPIRFYP